MLAYSTAGFGWVTRLLEWLRGSAEEKPDELEPPVQEPVSPLTYTENGDNTTLLVRLYQTQRLKKQRGRVPEQNIARFLGQAFADAGYNYEIEFGHDTLLLPDDVRTQTLLDFGSEVGDYGDINLLIGYRDGSGVSWGGGRYGLVAGGLSDHLVELTETAPVPDGVDGSVPRNLPGPYRNALNAIHEVGHLLGGRHEDNMTAPPSMLWTDTGKAAFDSPPAEGRND